MFNTVAIDSIFSTWTWLASSVNYPSTSFNLQYGSAGFDLYAGGVIVPVDNNLNDSILEVSLLSGGVYEIYVQAVCASDTSQFVGPFSVTMPLTNDSICYAETLPADGVAYVFNNTGATVDAQDVDIAPPATGATTTTGWVNNFMNNTTWFKFIAPSSGDIRINGTAVNFNGQIAVYSPNSCTSIIANDLDAANDDAIGGTSVAPNFTICNLMPGQMYYLMHDGFSAPGVYSIAISEIILNAGVANGIVNVCYGDTAALFSGLSNYSNGGVWTQQIPTLGLQDSLFNTIGLASSIYPFTYTLTDGCATDAEIVQVEIYSPSRAGDNGAITACLNEPFDLLAALAGNVDFGGYWLNPQNIQLPGSLDTAGAIGGQFNYEYVVTNGVCPQDTALIVVNVDPSCDYSVGLNEYSLNVSIYPNPSFGVFQIKINGLNQQMDVDIEDINGRVIQQMNKDFIQGDGSYFIDISKSVTGIYFVRLKSNGKDWVYKISKQ
jgi:hypothetical protein